MIIGVIKSLLVLIILGGIIALVGIIVGFTRSKNNGGIVGDIIESIADMFS